MEFGLVGLNLSHSYSKIIHQKIGLYKYELYSVSLSELKNILSRKNFKGLNITMPYKKEVLSFCDYIDEKAKVIGSVNTLKVNEDKSLCGYNTDYFGLKYTAKRSNISFKNKKVIILGSGGTSATARVLSQDLNAREVLVVSRNSPLNYKNIYDYSNADIIINTTPVGMYPHNGEKLIEISKFKNLSGVIDAIYNPFYTPLILDSKRYSIPFATGLPMLVAQAKMSSEIFSGQILEDTITEKIIRELYLQLSNISLIGMPGCGKSTIGKLLAKKTGKIFIDTDLEIEKRYGMSIPQIFKKYGEKEFRKAEKQIINEYGKKNNLIISTGGGAVLDFTNYLPLKQNGKIYHIVRNLNLLATNNRPLSKNLEEMSQIREPFYKKFSDESFENNQCLEDLVLDILMSFSSGFTV